MITTVFLFFKIISYSFSLEDFPKSFKIQDGYYFGSDNLFEIVFVKVKNDTAFVDFIFYQKYPRELLSDTLIQNSSTKKWFGKKSKLYELNNKIYVSANEPTSIFSKRSIRIKENENYYKNYFEEYKKIATQHMIIERNKKLYSKDLK